MADTNAFEPHARWMRRCLELANRAKGQVSPNPLVGCVLVNAEGAFIAEGWHRQAGGSHAEVDALRQAGERSRGATAYVNLEPCDHTGRTPPCTEALLAAGIRQVVYGITDPNPKVAGQGLARLQAQDVTIVGPVLAEACGELNRMFCHHIVHRRPYIALKQAVTADGYTATRHGESQWITGPAARRRVHEERAAYDALLTSAQTVLADNCELTVRYDVICPRPPVRVILDRLALLSEAMATRPVLDTNIAPTWIITSRSSAIYPPGVRVLYWPDALNPEGLWHISTLTERLYTEGICSIWVEAGATLAGAFIAAQQIQRLYLFYAPLLMGDVHAQHAFTIGPSASLNQLAPWRLRTVETGILPDWLVVLDI